MLTEQSIQEAFQGKIEATRTLATSIEVLAGLKIDRARKLAEAVSNGLYAECKNEDARKAAASVAMTTIDEQIATWERLERENRRDYDVACITVQMVEALLKLKGA